MKALLNKKPKSLIPIVPALFAAAILGTPLASPGHAQAVGSSAQCNARESVLSTLASKYKEAPVQMGLTNAGAIIEVTASEEGDSWSIILTTPAGITCMVAAGEHWEQVQSNKVVFTPTALEQVH